jgi:ParB family transcriptional regulator, chromosome partitioning protein
MNQKRPPLGKGLNALLGSMPRSSTLDATGGTAAASAGAETAADQLTRLGVDRLQRGRYQPRMDMRPESLQELADSIRAQGVVQPIVVRPIEMPGASEQTDLRYEIIAGERRWRAAQMAGLTEVPVVVRRVPDEAAIAMALIENIQREDLNPLEEARALDRLIREFSLTHQQAAEAVGRSRAAVSNLLRLLELAPEVAEQVERRELEMGHARALLGVADKRQQRELGILVSKKGLTVRETEALVRRLINGGTPTPVSTKPGTPAETPDANIRELETRLADTLGARVLIEHTAASGKGRLVIEYHSLDELDGILAHIR